MIRQPPPPNAGPIKAGLPERWRVMGICLALAVITFSVFGQTLTHDFVNYDDPDYVYENPVVAQGLTWRGLAWAFSNHAANWHPLTWLSHMLDCQWYGLHPAGHHLTSVLLHLATVIALFLVLRQMTGAVWPGAFVAAVFAVHPLRVESVAWIAERKDVLSGFFFVLTVGAYARYARLAGSAARYGLVLLLFALGLMCKPMLVTVPAVLLLLDYWPLQRKEPVGKLIVEKLPLVALSVVSCVLTFRAQNPHLSNTGAFALDYRLENAAVSTVIYLRQMFWPAGLALFYPFPRRGVAPAEVLLVGVCLLLITAFAFSQWRRRRWILVGWLWYLIMLLPVVGLIQVGEQAHADRYTYLPQIGLYLAITWSAAGWFAERWVGVLMAGIIGALMVCAWRQTAYWKNSETIWTRTIACTTDNETAHNNLSVALLLDGRVDDAIAQARQAVRIRDRFAKGHYNLGVALLAKGQADEAVAEFQKALSLDPLFSEAHFNLAHALRKKGRLQDAIAEYEEALRLNPSLVAARNDLGTALREDGRVSDAVSQYQLALGIDPNNDAIHVNLARALEQEGRIKEAILQYRRALQIQPADMEVQNNLAWLLATSADPSLRNGAQAVELAQQANVLAGGNNAIILGTLAAALAESGQFSKAVPAAEKAAALARAAGQQDLAPRLAAQLQLYRSGCPFHARQ